MITLLDPAQYRRTPWKNGGGTTIDIAEQGEVWRFGRTPIAAPGPFSDYTGFDRLQVLIAGRGLVLETPTGEIDVRAPFKPVRFAGETPIKSRLEAGPVEVVNLIGARSEVRIALEVLQPGDRRTVEPGTHIAYAAAGAVVLEIDGKGHGLAADHALHIAAPGPTMIACRDGVLLLGSVICA
jgi:environmental stress-induced protein Ves